MRSKKKTVQGIGYKVLGVRCKEKPVRSQKKKAGKLGGCEAMTIINYDY